MNSVNPVTTNAVPAVTETTQDDQGGAIRQSISDLNQLIANWNSPDASDYWEQFLSDTTEPLIQTLNPADVALVNSDINPLANIGQFTPSNSLLQAAGATLCDLSVAYLNLAQQNPSEYPTSALLDNSPSSIAQAISAFATPNTGYRASILNPIAPENFQTTIAYAQNNSLIVFPGVTENSDAAFQVLNNDLGNVDDSKPNYSAAWTAFETQLGTLLPSDL